MKECKSTDTYIVEDDSGTVTALVNATLYPDSRTFRYICEGLLHGLEAMGKYRYHDRPAYRIDDENGKLRIWMNAMIDAEDFDRIFWKAEAERRHMEQAAEESQKLRKAFSMAQSAEDKLDSLEAIIKRTAEEAEKTRKKLDEIIRQIATD